ncbi:MAG: NAD-dependent deacylase [Gemmataceae bacterium]|jgi:NAD-dependent deacetylase|nr:NAD-dependent deacylase [Gemmataceae bacterium]
MNLTPYIEKAAEILRKANRVAVLTGAGVSAESGVPTFRASDGLWEGHRIEDVASPEGWRRNPDLVWTFYNARRVNVAKVQPNPGHYALAEMEKIWQDRFDLITQNVDGLHQRAGNTRVWELHGALNRTECTVCSQITDRGYEDLGTQPECERCGGRLRPNIVWFGEGLPQDIWQQAYQATLMCDVFLVIGTSAVVYPAAGLVQLAKQRGYSQRGLSPAEVIEINLNPSDAVLYVDVGIYGPSGQVLPQLLDRLRKG